MIVVEFKNTEYNCIVEYFNCNLLLFNCDCKKSLTKYFQKSFQCSFVLQFEKQISKIIKRVELKIELKKIEKLKISKFIFVVVDIEYFDSIFLCDIQKLDLYHETIIFCQQLQNIRINYREIDLIQLFHICLRDFALT